MDCKALGLGRDLFGFQVQYLPDFVGCSWLQASVVDDMRSDLDFLASGVGLNAGIEMGICPSDLDVEGTDAKERR